VYDEGFAEAFEAAWRAASLESCPPLKTWYDLLDRLPRDPVASWAPIDVREFNEPEPPLLRPDTSPPPREVRSVPPVGATQRAPQATQRAAPVQAAPRPRRRGCRGLVAILLVLGLLCCYALAMVIEWSVLANVF